jgi:dipeptidyl aminopeptidase/acylaminoacyl peptidase
VCRVLAIAVLLLSTAGQQPAPQTAQPAPPATEVYVTPLGVDRMPMTGGMPTNISNNPGYDNQPSFLPDGSGLLFTSNRDGKQTDIYRYDFASSALSQVTRTSENEYSPLVTPDRKSFSVIRVEADGTQRLWRFDLDGSNPRLVLENVKPVGYHVWIDETRLALFVLGGQGQPNTLQVADTKTGQAQVIESGIGRSLLLRPGKGTVSFVSKPTSGHWVVKEFDPRTRAVQTFAETADDNRSEDFAWHPNGTLLMASGTKLLGWLPAPAAWKEVGDFSPAGLGRITRLAVGPFGPAARGVPLRIALVADPPR